MRALRGFGSFPLASRMLMINQFGINLGFYMLMPYLAAYLGGSLGLAAWAIGLVMGVRNFSQQGMFILGGTLADRLGYKPLIVAGCLLRTAGFGLLVVAHSLPIVLIASAATGFAGALFNPAVRAYLAEDSGERRVEAFAMFNVFYQAGILAGPVVGLALLAVDFRLVAGGAAVVFAALTAAQLFALPGSRTAAPGAPASVIDDWRSILRNRSFVLFAVAMIGSYVLTFQIYLALPLHAAHLQPQRTSALVAAMFVVSGAIAVAGQFRITRWFSARWGSGRSLAIGMTVVALSFLPILLAPSGIPGIAALIVAAALLAIGSAAIFPFEMDTVVALSGGRLVGTHYGIYSTIVGTGILLGNVATGWLMQTAGSMAWLILIGIGLSSAAALYQLDRSGRLLRPAEQSSPAAMSTSRTAEVAGVRL